MKILILGVGEVGYNIAKHLTSSENQITVVDHNEDRLNAISDLLDVRPIFGHASYPDVLEKARAEEADILIAVTNSDEVNIVACEVCHSLFDVEVKIARIKNTNYLENKYKSTLYQPQNLSVDFIISPELEVAKFVSRSLQIPGTTLALDLTDNIKLLGVRCLESSPITNTPLHLLKGIFPQLSIVVVAIQRCDQTIIPSPQDALLPNDTAYFILVDEQITPAMEAFGYTGHRRQKIMIAGSGRVGLTLAQEIERNQPDVQLVLLEKDRQRSENASRLLTSATVLHGDVLNDEILQEAGTDSCDAFVSTTADDHVNILAALLAKDHGARRTLALLEVVRNTQFYMRLGVDSLINQNAITVASALKAIRQHKIRSLYTIENGVELVEAYISESSQIVGMSVRDVFIAGQVFIAILQRQHEIFIRPKNLIITAHDHLIFAASQSVIPKLEKLVSGRSLYS